MRELDADAQKVLFAIDERNAYSATQRAHERHARAIWKFDYRGHLNADPTAISIAQVSQFIEGCQSTALTFISGKTTTQTRFRDASKHAAYVF